jgi:hypothetical protein
LFNQIGQGVLVSHPQCLPDQKDKINDRFKDSFPLLF